MKFRFLSVGVALGALMLPVAAHAQVVTGAAVGGAIAGPVGAVVGGLIGGANVTLFSDYVASQRYPYYTYAGQVAVGAQLPPGVPYYRVPADYYTPLYYTVLNNQTVLVDPTTRRIVQVVQ
jgi:hypothetical protein